MAPYNSSKFAVRGFTETLRMERRPRALVGPDTAALGIHFCLGRRVGLQSGMLARHSLLRRFPDLRLVDRPVWRKTIPTRRPDRLDVTLA
jgi:cytochrome P450